MNEWKCLQIYRLLVTALNSAAKRILKEASCASAAFLFDQEACGGFCCSQSFLSAIPKSRKHTWPNNWIKFLSVVFSTVWKRYYITTWVIQCKSLFSTWYNYMKKSVNWARNDPISSTERKGHHHIFHASSLSVQIYTVRVLQLFFFFLAWTVLLARTHTKH